MKVLAMVCAAYPTVELSEEQVAIWQEMLSDTPFQTGLTNLKDYIRSNRFPPTIADIIQEQDGEPAEDPEIRARNIEIAHAQWVRDGNDPEAFVYEPNGDSIKRLTS